MKKIEYDKNVSNNIIKNIRSPEKIRVMLALNCDEKYINGKASDFEWFDGWERILPLAEGHCECKKYAEELEMLGLPFPNGAYSRERSIIRWKMAHGYGERGEVPRELEHTAEKNRAESDALNVNINEYVSNNAIKYPTLSEMARGAYETLGSNGKIDIKMILDISSFEYHRPDPYYSDICYRRYICGEKLNESELCAMYAQILTELLLGLRKDKNNRKMSLNFLTDGNISCACALVEYFNFRRLFEGNVEITADAHIDTDMLYRFLEKVYPSIYITPVLCIKSSSPGELRDLFYRYPRGAIKIMQ